MSTKFLPASARAATILRTVDRSDARQAIYGEEETAGGATVNHRTAEGLLWLVISIIAIAVVTIGSCT